jgi:hypothetical protein
MPVKLEIVLLHLRPEDAGGSAGKTAVLAKNQRGKIQEVSPTVNMAEIYIRTHLKAHVNKNSSLLT